MKWRYGMSEGEIAVYAAAFVGALRDGLKPADAAVVATEAVNHLVEAREAHADIDARRDGPPSDETRHLKWMDRPLQTR